MNKALTAIWVFVVLAMGVVFFLHWSERAKFRQELSDADINHIARELTAQNADDCVLTQVSGGYVCKEFRTGKTFVVTMK